MRLSLKKNIAIGLLLSSLASLICFGIVGIGRKGVSNVDGAVLYAAGRAWLNGANPYDRNQLVQSVAGIPEIDLEYAGFFYPPQTAAFSIFVALFNYPAAKIVWLLLNLLSIAVIVAITIYTINRHPNHNGNRVASWVMSAVIIGNPFTNHVVWMGQTSLIAFAAIMASWLFGQQKKWVLAGICLGLASFKPQLSVLIGLWFLLERNWKTLAVSLLTAAVMSIYPMWVMSPMGMLIAWHQGIQDSYYALPYNTLGFQDKVGFESLFAAAGLTLPGLKFLALVLVAILWLYRNRINQEDILGIIMGISFSFVGYTHVYDYVGLMPLLTSLWMYSYNNRKAWLGSIALVFLLFLPRRFILGVGVPVLMHWRTVVVLIIMTFVFLQSMRHKDYQKLQREMVLSEK